MTLPDYHVVQAGTKIVLANSGEYSPTQGQPARTDQLDLGNLADTNFRQSTKFDFGAQFAMLWKAYAHIELFSSPTAGKVVNFHIGYSSSGTAANDNMANLSGTDGAYQGYGADVASAQEAVKLLDFIGDLPATADTDIMAGEIGFFVPRDRYGIIVVENVLGIALAATDAIETCVVLAPVLPLTQENAPT